MRDSTQAAAQAIRSAIDQAISSSQEGVLAVGSCINRMISEGTRHNQEIERLMTPVAGGDENLLAMVAEQTAHSAALASEVKRQSAEQENLTAKAIEQSSQIAVLGERTRKVTAAARMLALNAQLEGTRFGAEGAPFMVIAREMKDLANEVAIANESIAELATGLSNILPMLAETTRVICEHVEAFRRTINRQQVLEESSRCMHEAVANAAAESERSMAAMMTLAYQAISNLQFQDPMVQLLMVIPDRVDAVVSGRAEDELGSDLSATPTGGAHSTASGDVLMW